MTCLVWARHSDRLYSEQSRPGPFSHRATECERHRKQNMAWGPLSEQSMSHLTWTCFANSLTVLVVASLVVLRVYVYNLIIWKQFFLFFSNYAFSCFILFNYIGEYLQHNIKNQWEKYIHLLLPGSNVKASSISYIGNFGNNNEQDKILFSGDL